MTFSNKVVLVTGAGSGIGRATALALAEAGAAVMVGQRNEERGRDVVKAIERVGGRAAFLRTDVARSDEVKALVDATVDTFGRLDCAYNNAAESGDVAPLADQDLEGAGALLDVNIKGVFFCMKHEIDRMLAQGGGAIVNCSSVYGIVGLPGAALYTATKHAVVGMTRAAALDYAQKGIRINAVAPGLTRTPMLEKVSNGNPDSFAPLTPMGRIAEPDEIARGVLWLLSDAASYVTGHVLAVDGAYCAQ